jgi:hypothetical protein
MVKMGNKELMRMSCIIKIQCTDIAQNVPQFGDFDTCDKIPVFSRSAQDVNVFLEDLSV